MEINMNRTKNIPLVPNNQSVLNPHKTQACRSSEC
jgi:hypothetical protein